MKKIISLFQRNYEGDKLVRDEVVPGAEWVLAGEGMGTRKYDGTCCLVAGGRLFKRFDAKNGKTPPVGFIPAQDPDPVTAHWPGWLPVGDGPDDKWFREAWDRTGDPERPAGTATGLADGTYELCGPKVQGNPEGFEKHVLVRHGCYEIAMPPRTFEGLRDFFRVCDDIEGIVWHHPDGRMVKIKAKDFGVKRVPRSLGVTV